MPTRSRQRDDDDRPRKRRKRKRAFPIGILILILALVPLLAVGGYYGVKALRGSDKSKSDKDAKIDEMKKKLVGEWAGFEENVLANIVISDEKIIVKATSGGRGGEETFNWKVDGSGDNSITLRMTSTRTDRVNEIVWEFEFLSDSQVRVTSKSGKKQTSVFTKKGAGGDAVALTGNAKRLVGKWELPINQGGVKGKMIHEFNANGSAAMSAVGVGGNSPVGALQWKSLGESGKSIKIRMWGQGFDQEFDIEFLSNDEHQIVKQGQAPVKFRRVR